MAFLKAFYPTLIFLAIMAVCVWTFFAWYFGLGWV